MDNHEAEKQAYIERRVRRALSTRALNRIRKVVDQIEADDRKARIAVYIFLLLFCAGAVALIFMISHAPH